MKREWLVFEVLDRTCNQKGYLKRLSRGEEFQHVFELSESIKKAIFYDANERQEEGSLFDSHLAILNSEFKELDFEILLVRVEQL